MREGTSERRTWRASFNVIDLSLKGPPRASSRDSATSTRKDIASGVFQRSLARVT